MHALPPAIDSDASFTLDAGLLEERRAANAHRVHTVQLPTIRAGGFAILCAIAILQDVRLGAPLWQPHLLFVLALNVAYPTLSWLVLRRWYGRTGRLDLGLFFLHLDILIWLPNLRHLEQAHLFFGYLLLIRVADQVGYGFRRALYFGHVIVVTYLLYSLWVATQPGDPLWSARLTIAAAMYLLGIYLAFTGLVSARLRDRARQAMRSARELVDSLEQKKEALEIQSRELEEAKPKGGGGERRQGPVPGDDQPRDPHADERRARHDRAAARDAARGAPAPPRRNGAPLGDGAAGADRRRDRPVAHRSQQADAPVDQLRPARARHRCRRPDGDDGARQAADPRAARSRRALPAWVEGDPMRLRQVLVNLLHNAVKFTERGGIALDLIVLDDTADEVRLLFEVRDTGIGLAKDQFDSVFDAFTQVDASSTRRHGGTGLGLAIVKELAELMGGQVGVDSRLEEGSTFWFEVSLKKGAPPAEAVAPAAAAATVLSARILLAEDDAVNQMVVEQMLIGMGCVVDTVDDGDAACVAAAGIAYDLIFMDCHMPGLDGFEATRRIRAEADPEASAHADRRPHRRRTRRRSRALPRLGHGRLHDQAGQQRAARRGGAALGRCRRRRAAGLRAARRPLGVLPAARGAAGRRN